MPFHGPELIIILAIALLIFGPKKLPEMGSAIGKSIKEFKKGMSELTAPKDDFRASTAAHLEAIEREIATKKAAAAEASTATATKVVDADEPEVQTRKEDKTEDKKVD